MRPQFVHKHIFHELILKKFYNVTYTNVNTIVLCNVIFFKSITTQFECINYQIINIFLLTSVANFDINKKKQNLKYIIIIKYI